MLKNEEKIKQCKGCGRHLSAYELINDPDIRPIGMSFLANNYARAFFFFQHEVSECGSSFLVDVELLDQYIYEYFPEESLILTKNCDGHCVNINDLNNCQNACHNAPYRRFLLKMIAFKKEAAETNRSPVTD